MSFVNSLFGGSKPQRPTAAPPAPQRVSPAGEAAGAEATRRAVNRGPSLRAATLLGRGGSPRRQDSFSVTSLLGSQSI